MIASCPGFRSDNFILEFNEYKAKFTELHFLTNFEIMHNGSGKNIYFFFNGVKLTLRNRKKLKQFLKSVFKLERVKLESINYIFSTDKAVHSINKEFLKHDFYTDIITFSLSENGQPVVADIYISVDRVKENAFREKETVQKELHRVVFHGALHLCGYRDKTRAEIKRMRKREDYYLSKYFG